MKTFKEILKDGEAAEIEAVRYYTFLLPFLHNGNERRSILHILNEEKDHLEILQKIIRRLP